MKYPSEATTFLVFQATNAKEEDCTLAVSQLPIPILNVFTGSEQLSRKYLLHRSEQMVNRKEQYKCIRRIIVIILTKHQKSLLKNQFTEGKI